MIGISEREVRYEIQIQRLLKRADADQRRIVCLSASLPTGDQFDDFVSWLRRDQDGTAIISDWRPTRIRFGEVLWAGNRARLELRVGDERPFVPNFFSAQVPSKGKRKAAFPRDQRELVLATSWRLVEDGQSVLIYCPQRSSVEPFATAITDLHNRGLLDSVLDHDPAVLNTALAIGREWLGENHPILICLQLGVAIHHGALPTPFRKEMECLLRDGILKITVASPTLAQGINLTATSLIIHSLFRNGEIVPPSEFRNVIGRAGRAFIDVEGLVLYPIYDDHAKRRFQWQRLINDTSTLSMESGLIRLVESLLARLHRALGRLSLDDLLEYVVNNAVVWDFPEIEGEKAADRDRALRDWAQYLASLDTAILSLAGDQDIEADQISAKLDEAMDSSLWKRRLLHQPGDVQTLLDTTLKARAGLIWSASTSTQRKGYFLAGVGLTSGKQLDSIAQEANSLLVEANGAILAKESERAIEAITALAERLFSISPFVPDPFPENWRQILSLWLEGSPIAAIGEVDMTDVLRFIENGLVYRLPWGMEAIRVRAQASQDNIGGMTIDAFEVGLAVPSIETGTLNRSAAILIQAGFTSRLAAIKAVTDTEAEFTTTRELGTWLRSDDVRARTGRADWPTPESSFLWKSFLQEYEPSAKRVWSVKYATRVARWQDNVGAPPDTPIKVYNSDGVTFLLSATHEFLGHIDPHIVKDWSGLLLASVGKQSNTVDLTYFGPDDIDL